MKINRLHTIIGLLLVIIPFTGFTRGFKYGFSVAGGAVILFFAMKSIHQEVMKKQQKHKKHDSYVESKPRSEVRSRSKAPVIVETSTELESTPSPSENNNQSSNHIANESR